MSDLKYCIGECHRTKFLSEFVKDKSRVDGRKNICKECHRKARKQYVKDNSEKAATLNKNWVAANPDKIQTYRLRKYNVTLDRYKSLLSEQENSCAIFSEVFGNDKKSCPRVDHNHACCEGQKSCGNCIRGLLCDSCNVLLGRIKDDVSVLQRAIDYLQKEAHNFTPR